jgi:hypothetical protein
MISVVAANCPAEVIQFFGGAEVWRRPVLAWLFDHDQHDERLAAQVAQPVLCETLDDGESWCLHFESSTGHSYVFVEDQDFTSWDDALAYGNSRVPRYRITTTGNIEAVAKDENV